MTTFFLKPNCKKGRAGLEKGLIGVDATLVSASLFGKAGWEGGFLEGASVFGGLTPFIPSIPSIVTVFPSGSLSAFSFFFPINGTLEQEVRRKISAVKEANMKNKFFLFLIMEVPSFKGMADFIGCYLTHFYQDVKRGEKEKMAG
jgi:hypothetical protein